ncbi:MAG: PIN domain-containing protein [Nanoarchaeota archaeon]
MVETYFYDTYALVELIKGNENYLKYKLYKIITTKLNLLELYSALLRDYNEKKAEYYYSFYSKYCINLNDDIIKDSAKLWHSMRKENKKPSYIDCIGYIAALRLKIKFLTGDKEFKDLKNVEFVK